jgi:hypothetical protein
MILRVSPALIWCEFSTITPSSAFLSRQERAIHTPNPKLSPKIRCANSKCSGKVYSTYCFISLHFCSMSSSVSIKLYFTTVHRLAPFTCAGKSLIIHCRVKGLILSTVSLTTSLLLFDRVFLAFCTLFLN